MSYWSKLSMKDRANVMKLFLDKGISDLDTIRREYNTFAEGGSIHIDPSKKGTFTAAASKHGMGVQEFASKVLANKEDYSPAMVKKANFARNASKWHGLGGNLFDDGGSYSYTKPLDNVYVDSEGNLLDPNVPSARGTVQLPEVIATTRDPRKPVPTAFDKSINPYLDIFEMASKAMQPLSVSQHVGAAFDALQGERSYARSLYDGNSGFFSDNYAKNHPVITSLGNIIGDVVTTSGISKAASKLPTYLRLERNYTGVPHRQVEKNGIFQFDSSGNPIYMNSNFPKVHNDVTVWGVNKADYARNYSLDDGNIYKVYTDRKELADNVLETPKPLKDQYYDWDGLPFETKDGKVSLAKDAFELPKAAKSKSKIHTLAEDNHLVVSPSVSTSTDAIVDYSKQIGKDATRFTGINDFALTNIWGTPYAAKVNELVLNPGTNNYILKHYTPKIKLLFDNQIPAVSTPFSNPLMPLNNYERD